MVTQEYQFKINQLESKHFEELKKLTKEHDKQISSYTRTKEDEFCQLLRQEQATFDVNRVKHHASVTQEVYEEIYGVLRQKFKEDQKQEVANIKKDMNTAYKMELEKRENRINALLARERSERGKVELHNAQLEV